MLIRERERRDPVLKFKHNVRNLIGGSFKRIGFVKSMSTEKLLGCTLQNFQLYISSKFKEGMTLENHGKWHLDHIIPLAIAKTEEEVIKLCHYTNFQPLWAKENREKSGKWSLRLESNQHSWD